MLYPSLSTPKRRQIQNKYKKQKSQTSSYERVRVADYGFYEIGKSFHYNYLIVMFNNEDSITTQKHPYVNHVMGIALFQSALSNNWIWNSYRETRHFKWRNPVTYILIQCQVNSRLYGFAASAHTKWNYIFSSYILHMIARSILCYSDKFNGTLFHSSNLWALCILYSSLHSSLMSLPCFHPNWVVSLAFH